MILFVVNYDFQAGITDNHLIIALEPEAASIYCQYVKTRGTDDTFKVSKLGTQYMVVDLGGRLNMQREQY